MVDCDPNSLWCYDPNKPAAYAFTVLYFLNALGHIYQCWKYRAKYTIPLAVGSLFTTVGFAFKVWSSYYPDILGAWITAVILLFTAPPIYSAADYFIFAKTLNYVPGQAPMHPGRVVTTFVAADGLCEMLMGTGVGQIVNFDNPTKVNIGGALIKTGLLLQIVLFIGFVAVVLRFHSNVKRANLEGRWTTVLFVLYISAFVISVRCLYRSVEYWMGITGAIYRNESYFQVFEASLMLINVLVLNIWHPGRYLPKSNKAFLNNQGVEERSDRGGWEDKRPFLLTLVDPFNITGLIHNQIKKRKEAKATNSDPLDTKEADV